MAQQRSLSHGLTTLLLTEYAVVGIAVALLLLIGWLQHRASVARAEDKARVRQLESEIKGVLAIHRQVEINKKQLESLKSRTDSLGKQLAEQNAFLTRKEING